MAKNTAFVTRYRTAADNFLKAFEELSAISNEFLIRQPELNDDDIAGFDITAAEFQAGAESVAAILAAYAGKKEARDLYLLRK